MVMMIYIVWTKSQIRDSVLGVSTFAAFTYLEVDRYRRKGSTVTVVSIDTRVVLSYCEKVDILFFPNYVFYWSFTRPYCNYLWRYHQKCFKYYGIAFINDLLNSFDLLWYFDWFQLHLCWHYWSITSIFSHLLLYFLLWMY